MDSSIENYAAHGTPDDMAKRGQNQRSIALVAATSLGLAGGYTALFAGTTGVFLLPIAQSLGVGRGTAASCMALASLGLAVSSPVAGRLMDRYGYQRVIGVSIICFVIGLLLLAAGPLTTTALGAKVFLLGLLGVATSPVGYLPILAYAFERRVGLAFGIASIGAGIGAALAPLFTGWMIRHYDWQTAYLLLAAVAAVIGFLAHTMLRRIPTQAQAAKATAGAAPALTGDAPRTAFTNPRFWLIGLCVALIAAVGLGSIVHVPALLSDNGVSPEMAAAGAAFSAIGLTMGRFLVGLLLDYIPARVLAAVVFLLGGCGVALLGTATHETPYMQLALGAMLTGMLIGAEGDLVPFFVKRYFGLKNFGAIYGVLISLFCLGTMFGPAVYGLAFDRFRSYDLVMVTAGIVCAVCAVGILLIGAYRYPDPHKAART
ncbi:MFS transporter [Bordetella genomosp. 13]|uniref:MFS transporter n=1 Tax=Bordetella genomosp. 13 TaxID=463040 RepID=UPI0011A34BF3|nr:MFS transporter [Bordetella genomosp. 13]